MLNSVPSSCSGSILTPVSPPLCERRESTSIVETIFRGVTEDIFGAFHEARPGMFQREFDSFVANVRRGLGIGVGDAHWSLTLSGEFGPDAESRFHANSGAIFERLEIWFAETRARLFS